MQRENCWHWHWTICVEHFLQEGLSQDSHDSPVFYEAKPPAESLHSPQPIRKCVKFPAWLVCWYKITQPESKQARNLMFPWTSSSNRFFYANRATPADEPTSTTAQDTVANNMRSMCTARWHHGMQLGDIRRQGLCNMHAHLEQSMPRPCRLWGLTEMQNAR